MNVEDLATKQQASKHKIHATTKLQGCVKLPQNRQYNTSLGEGKKWWENLNSPCGIPRAHK
jgi:hypothetical protein